MDKTKHIFYFSLILTILLFCSEVKAQGPPIFTDTPILLSLDGGGIRTFGQLISKENAKLQTSHSGQTQMRELMGIGQQSQYDFPNGMVAFQSCKKHHHHMIIGGELLYVPLHAVSLGYFTDSAFVNELY